MRTEMINLLKSTSPFVGETGKTLIQVIINLNDLMSSETASKTIHAFSALRSPQIPVTKAELEDSKSLEKSNPYALFLILILLILATEGIYAATRKQNKTEENATQPF